MQPVDPATLTSLPQTIGTDRFAPYLVARSGNPDEGIRLYTWNVEASAALLGAYAALEVGLRNAIHDQLRATFNRDDWWEAAPITYADLQEVRSAEGYLDQRKGPGSWSAGHVVAELKTSFWEGLLVNRYHASLWETGLKQAFPHYAGRRSDLRARMERLRFLRNRAAHHEPIFARDLSIDHQYMCELAGYVSLDLATWIASHSRLPSVIVSRSQTILGARPSRF
ncbi:hypothetical protein [Curtobacterium sp. MWU13-2055]|uniref:hypothetical protein n=1 Tax=Curtobacterium sp. MWU13-2055 TaxID=2931928 RepID=UPI0020105D01|nr:hypothetical protein [Curtobacterium sp. MWU13-2055]